MDQNTILCVSAGTHLAKNHFKSRDYVKDDVYLSYGLLGLATNLANKGFDARMFQGDTKSIEMFCNEIKSQSINLDNLNHPILIALQSMFAIDWANDFIAAIKKENPEQKIIAGGRWVIDKNHEWIKQKMPNVDFFALGCPDNVIAEMLDPKNWHKFNSPQISVKPFSKLNYSLLNNFKLYQPSIDVGRGCPGKCNFCNEKDQPYGFASIKTPQEAIQEIQNICELYGSDTLNVGFPVSHFSPTKQWAEEFAKLYKEHGMKFNWRTQGRADMVNPEIIRILAGAGLKVLDIGLESASPEQLIKMQKTNNPKEYLKKAEHLIKTTSDAGVWPKLNLLFYPGETHKTLDETQEWLAKNKGHYKGCIANPFTLYRNGEDTAPFVEYIENLSGSRPDTAHLENHGYTYVDLSKEIPIEKAKTLCNDVVNRFTSPKDFKELKEVWYTPREI